MCQSSSFVFFVYLTFGFDIFVTVLATGNKVFVFSQLRKHIFYFVLLDHGNSRVLC